MLVCFIFRAKPGLEREFESLLATPEGGRHLAAALNATRNCSSSAKVAWSA